MPRRIASRTISARRLAVPALSVLLAGVAACSSGTQTAQPSTRPVAASSSTASSAPSPTTGPGGITVVAGRSLDGLDRSVPGEATSWYARDEARRVRVDLPEMTGTRRPDAVVGLYRPYASSFLQELAQRPIPASTEAAPSLTIGWHVVAAGQTVTGTVVTTEEFGGASGTDDTRVHWVERPSGRLLSWQDMIDPAQRASLLRDVAGALQAHPAVFDDEVQPLLTRAPQPATPERIGAADTPTVAFGGDGSALLLVPEGTVAPYSVGSLQVRIPASRVASALSALGQDARQASTSPVPTPTPEPAPDEAVAPAAKVDCAKVRCVALTFDDGPAPTTPRLLDILAAQKAPATFFMLGEQVTQHPDIARQVVQRGHRAANHSWNHPQLTALDAAGVRSQLSRTQQAISSVTGTTPTWLRPPYGARDAQVDRIVREAGLSTVLWDVDSLDWKSRNAAAIRREIARQVHRDSIVLLHDIHPTTVAAVPGVIADLKAAGYTIAPLADVLATGKAKAAGLHR